MINAIDIKHWQEEFEQFAKVQGADLSKTYQGTYIIETTQKMWDAYLSACINMMNLMLSRTPITLKHE